MVRISHFPSRKIAVASVSNKYWEYNEKTTLISSSCEMSVSGATRVNRLRIAVHGVLCST